MPRPDHSLDALQVFEVCARHGSFTKSAAELCVTPAAVSARIRDLEAKVGVKLFNRSGPNLSLTESGARLASRLSGALIEIQSAIDACRGDAPALRVTATPTFALRWLTPRLNQFSALCPDLVICLEVSTEIKDATSFDVAVRTGIGGWRGFDTYPLMPVTATPMLCPRLMEQCRIAEPADLSRLPLLPHDDWERWFAEVGTPGTCFDLGVVDGSIHEVNAVAAINGMGAALLQPEFYGSLVSEGKLVQPFEHVLSGPAKHYALLPEQGLHPQARTFCDWMIEAVMSESAIGRVALFEEA